jgi:hypothetical protein
LREERDLDIQRGINMEAILGAYRSYYEVEVCNLFAEGNGLFTHWARIGSLMKLLNQEFYVIAKEME